MFSFDWKNRGFYKSRPNLGRLTLQRSKIAIERLSRFRFFSAEDYVGMHPDIGGMDSATHYVGYGADERRQAAKSVHIARTLGEFGNQVPPPKTETDCISRPLHVGLYVSSLSNVFMREIAGALAILLRSAGHNVVEGDENSEIEDRPNYSVYVAPHEFFFLGRGSSWIRDDVLASACMYCTEQVQTKWFWETVHIVLMARSVIDMSMPVAAAFAEVMPSACIFPTIGEIPPAISPAARTHPLLLGQRWWMDREIEGGTESDRPLDLCFLGTVSPYRARFFSRNAERLGRYEAFLYLRTGNATEAMNAATGETHLADVAQYVARKARVLLNVHRDEFPYFEWHRLVYQGIANGCAVVSEPCFVNPEYEPGVHYLTEESHHLMDLLDWVLNDADGKAKAAAVAAAGFGMARNAETQRSKAQMLVDLLMA